MKVPSTETVVFGQFLPPDGFPPRHLRTEGRISPGCAPRLLQRPEKTREVSQLLQTRGLGNPNGTRAIAITAADRREEGPLPSGQASLEEHQHGCWRGSRQGVNKSSDPGRDEFVGTISVSWRIDCCRSD